MRWRLCRPLATGASGRRRVDHLVLARRADRLVLGRPDPHRATTPRHMVDQFGLPCDGRAPVPDPKRRPRRQLLATGAVVVRGELAQLPPRRPNLRPPRRTARTDRPVRPTDLAVRAVRLGTERTLADTAKTRRQPSDLLAARHASNGPRQHADAPPLNSTTRAGQLRSCHHECARRSPAADPPVLGVCPTWRTGTREAERVPGGHRVPRMPDQVGEGLDLMPTSAKRRRRTRSTTRRGVQPGGPC